MMIFERFSTTCIIWCFCSTTYFNSFSNSKSINVKEDWHKEWNLFKKNFEKNYKTAGEENKRMEIFKENFFKIHKHNERYDKGEESYSMGINQFSDLLHKEYLSIVGSPSPNISELTLSEPALVQEETPNEINWVARGKVTPVGNQGKYNVGWAFSVTGALESAKAIKDEAAPVKLSEQNLIECSGGLRNRRRPEGNLQSAYKYVNFTGGVEMNVSYPDNFQRISSGCRYDHTKSAVSIKNFKAYRANEGNLRSAVASRPVSVYINPALESFKNYARGIYNDPKCDDSKLNSTAVLVVGYGTYNNTDYWLIKNSFGITWGEKGYMRLARNWNNLCGIADLIYYPVVN